MAISLIVAGTAEKAAQPGTRRSVRGRKEEVLPMKLLLPEPA
jgi:hypothetical protein